MKIYELKFSYSMYKYEGVWRDSRAGVDDTTYRVDAGSLTHAMEIIEKRFHVIAFTSVMFLFSLELESEFDYGEEHE